jgi:hypothetical protein
MDTPPTCDLGRPKFSLVAATLLASVRFKKIQALAWRIFSLVAIVPEKIVCSASLE